MYKLMKPLWLKYPELERYSIGWRMGYGEEYACDFWEWFDELSEEEQKEYKELFPELVTWKGFWEDESLEDFFDKELWDKVKYSIVLNGNWRKFSQNKDLRDYLLSTGDSILVEASPYDKIWGIGLSAEMEDAQNPNKWLGEKALTSQ